MLILPFKKITLETDYPNEKIISKLNSFVEGQPKIIEGLSRYKQTVAYYGKLQKKSFTLKRRADRDFQFVNLWILGKIENSAEKTRVHIRIRPNWFVLFLFLLAVWFGIDQMYASNAQTYHRKGELVFEQIFIFTVGISGSLIGMFLWSAHKAVQDLKTLLGATDDTSKTAEEVSDSTQS
jgi:hypothetical protein